MAQSLAYVPILRTKAAEVNAIHRIPQKGASRLLPLMLPPLDEKKLLTPEIFAARVALAVSQGAALIDVISDETLPLIATFEHLAAHSVQAIPVVPLSATSQAVGEAAKVVKKTKEGACIRLQTAELSNDPKMTVVNLDRLRTQLGVDRAGMDLLIDFGPISPSQGALIVLAAAGIIGALPEVEAWRRLVVAATAFPRDLRDFKPDLISTTPRTEWLAWSELSAKADLPRSPLFGDYTISHPVPIAVAPEVMTLSASLRYTAATNWLIARGRSVKKYGAGQIHRHCSALMKREEYMFESFSWGDKWIADCAGRKEKPGSAQTWREVGINHHLAFVLDQLAKPRAT
ncbi:MAG TPA: beta family protein [Thermoanaerobaculaceae bacterium]|nr:beta family protein [Thermoanaerobaculaceae bacterium]